MGIATAIEFCGPDANDYLIAQGAQAVQRGKRFGQAPQPSAYYKQGREPDLPTAIASSPFIAHLFVVGYATGSVW